MFGKKNAAIVVSILFICLVLFANVLIVVQHDHVHVGENCIICCGIDAAQKLLGGFVLLTILSILFAVLMKHHFGYILRFFKKYFFSTPILLKVKLSD